MRLREKWKRAVRFVKWVDCADNSGWSDRGGFSGGSFFVDCHVQPIRTSVFSGASTNINDSAAQKEYGTMMTGRYHIYMEQLFGVGLLDGVYLFSEDEQPDFVVTNADNWGGHVRLTVTRR